MHNNIIVISDNQMIAEILKQNLTDYSIISSPPDLSQYDDGNNIFITTTTWQPQYSYAISLNDPSATWYLPPPVHLNNLANLLCYLNNKSKYNINLTSDIILQTVRRQLYYQNRIISLTEKEAELILYLFSLPEKKASRQELLYTIWHYKEDIDSHTLETHIYRLRQKLPGNLIVTTSEGYQLTTNINEKNS